MKACDQRTRKLKISSKAEVGLCFSSNKTRENGKLMEHNWISRARRDDEKFYIKKGKREEGIE